MLRAHYILPLAFCLASFTLKICLAIAPNCTEDIRKNTCKLPSCRCSGVDIPGGFSSKQIPQLVHITFDDAVTDLNMDFYRETFFHRKNPNNEPITTTFFISHEYTSYPSVNELWRKGHEIALHSVTHFHSTLYWKNLTVAGWQAEITQQREQMAGLARISSNDIKGMRAPMLQMGGENMYTALQTGGFTWESSRATNHFRKPGLWPYTNDYLSTQDCPVPPCPLGQYKSFWTVPMIGLIGKSNIPCGMVDNCTPVPNTAEATYNLLLQNFEDHYTGTRAPFGIFAHSAWLNGTGSADIWQRRLGYIKFLDYLDTLNDVYIVSVSRGLEWVKNPQPLSSLNSFEHFKVTEKTNSCQARYMCKYTAHLPTNSGERYMSSCTPCPSKYPWIDNHLEGTLAAVEYFS